MSPRFFNRFELVLENYPSFLIHTSIEITCLIIFMKKLLVTHHNDVISIFPFLAMVIDDGHGETC